MGIKKMIDKIPNQIKLQVFADEKAVEGILCLLTAESNYKNNFNSIIGPSDSNGNIYISRENILSNANEDVKNFMMDYGNPLNCITGNYTITPMSISELNKAKAAFKSFNEFFQYPTGYINTIKNAISLLSNSSFLELKVKVISIDGNVKVKTNSKKIN